MTFATLHGLLTHLVTAFLNKIGKAPASDSPAELAKAMQKPDVIDAAFKELSTYHIGKLNGYEIPKTSRCA